MQLGREAEASLSHSWTCQWPEYDKAWKSRGGRV